MSGPYRVIEAFLGPGRERTGAGSGRPLVRVRLCDQPAGRPAAFTDLRADDARHLGCELIAAAAHAEALAAAGERAR